MILMQIYFLAISVTSRATMVLLVIRFRLTQRWESPAEVELKITHFLLIFAPQVTPF